MNTALDELKHKRLKWVEANRENRFDEGIKRLLTELYPDNAHFIYELLQNAEDAHAKNVQFLLNNDELVFEHDGERLFSLRDIDSITSIGMSTKRDDPTSIGKFGVGFKAVFAYTQTPEIHSGEFHFRIHDLVVPETDGVERLTLEGQTRFVFPFNHPAKPAARAIEEIGQLLRALDDNTLLFLSQIRRLEYRLPDGSHGHLERVERNQGQIEIHALHPDGREIVSHWLRFQKDVEVTDDDGKTKSCRIAIAYAIAEEEDGDDKNAKRPTAKKRRAKWKIVPLDHGQVSIYFPAAKETSNLRFHLHAPFASTVARDSVRDCPANDRLRDQLALLVVESLAAIRDQGLLTVGFLAVLPNPSDNLPPFYEPIRTAIVNAFRKQPLTPTKSGTHAPAIMLFRGPAKISNVLNDDDLARLLHRKPPLWAANPPQQNQREDRFLDSLEIRRFGWYELIKVLSNTHPFLLYSFDEIIENGEHKQLIESWIAEKEDKWMLNFYALLGEAFHSYYRLDASKLRIVRVIADQGHDHVFPSDAYFLPEGDQKIAERPDIRFVKPSVYTGSRSEQTNENALFFLKEIGVRPYNEKAIVELRLKEYDDPDTRDRITDKQHYRDMAQFISCWKKYRDSELFKKHPFLRGSAADGELEWYTPEELCLDSPYEETGLAELSHIHGKPIIWEGYKEKLPSTILNDLAGFLKSIGVRHHFEIKKVSVYNNPSKEYLQGYDWYARWTHNAINEDYTIENLEQYLNTQSITISRLIWHTLIQAEDKVAKARYRPNKQYQIREAESQLVWHLKNHAWIPDRAGTFRKPADMTRDDLRDDFPYDNRNGLLTAIGFGENARKRNEEYQAKNKIAKEMGFESVEELKQAKEFWRLARENGITLEDLRKRATQLSAPFQPEESVSNPERRRRGVLERRDNAPPKESITRERAILPGAKQEILEAKAYLRAKYTNADGQLICQCCHEVMPFKIKDEYYFEAVQCMRDLDRHYYENRLALCPTCAAMYQHARETTNDEIRRSILEHDAPETTSSVEINIKLAGQIFQLRFVGTHWFDLKTILQR